MKDRFFIIFFVFITFSAFSERETLASVRNTHIEQNLNAFERLPILFVRNDGQFPLHAKYYVVNGKSLIYFTNSGIYISLIQTPHCEKNLAEMIADNEKKIRDVIKIIPLSASRKMQIRSEGAPRARFNFLLGNDSSKWRTNVYGYSSILYEEVFHKVDLRFYGNKSGELEYDIIVKPGADVSDIKFGYQGIRNLKIDKKGSLVIHLRTENLKQNLPRIFQQIGSKTVDVQGSYIIKPNPGNGTFYYGFKLGTYNRAYPVFIDPVMSFSTYFGGIDGDSVRGIDVDSAGNIYITGETDSLDFPITPGAYQSTLQISEGFVTKLTPDGQSIIYSTFLGGSDADQCQSIKADDDGTAYVSCFTASIDFPTINPFQPSRHGDADSAVAKLSPNGSALLFSSYFGGSSDQDIITGIGINNHNLYVAGTTESKDFPTFNALQPNFSAGVQDGFLAKFNAAGNVLLFSTYWGGTGAEFLDGMTVDLSGNAYVTGRTDSNDFPITPGAYQTKCKNFCIDAFVSKISSDGSTLFYSTFLGGNTNDQGRAIAVDSSGAAYVAGDTSSEDFPIVNAAQPNFGGAADVFVTKISDDGSALIYSTFLGAFGGEIAYSLDLDNYGAAYVAGESLSTDFPTKNELAGKCHSERDIFVTKIVPDGATFEYSTCLGGTDFDNLHGIVVDGNGTAYVVGQTLSHDFPTRNAIFPQPLGFIDGFIAKISCNSMIGPSVYEDSGSAVFTVHLCRPAISNIQIQYSTADGSAIAGADYVSVVGVVTIPQGETDAVINVPLLDDDSLEGEEDFFLQLTSSDMDVGDTPVRASLLDSEGLLYDNFENGVVDWNVVKGKWQEGGGYLAGFADRTAQIFAPLPWTPSGNFGCGNCTIDVKMFKTSEELDKVIIEAWLQNNSNKVELIAKPFGKWVLKQRAAGKSLAKSKAISAIDPTGEYHIVLGYDGVNFNLEVNGSLILTMQAIAPPFGNVGFKSKSSLGAFRGIWVY